MRILILGAGVIGSVYAGRLHEAGHEVTLFVRGKRLTDLRTSGLILDDARSGHRTTHHLPVLASLDTERQFDLVLVSVRREQFAGAAAQLATSSVEGDVMLFGNATGLTHELVALLGARALLGFPAAGGVRDGDAIRYVLIRQQKTMVAESDGAITGRLKGIAAAFEDGGFSTRVSTDADAWLIAHAAFVVPVACALYRVDVDPKRLSNDVTTLRLMVRATREAFCALSARGNNQIPRNLRALYLYAPERFAVSYWRRTMASPRGEFWFAAHARVAHEEMTSLAAVLEDAVERTGRPAENLATLLRVP
jgi:2-dehydropantoate 2-reductase